MCTAESFQPRYHSWTDWGIQTCQKITLCSDKQKNNCLIGRITKLFLAVPFITLCAVAELTFWIAKTAFLICSMMFVICCHDERAISNYFLDFFSLVIFPIIAIVQAVLLNRLPQANRDINPKKLYWDDKHPLEEAVSKKDYHSVQRIIDYGIDPSEITVRRYHNKENMFIEVASHVDPTMMQILCSGNPEKVKKSLINLREYPYTSVSGRCYSQDTFDKGLKTIEIMLKATKSQNEKSQEDRNKIISNLFSEWVDHYNRYHADMTGTKKQFYANLIGLTVDHGAQPTSDLLLDNFLLDGDKENVGRLLQAGLHLDYQKVNSFIKLSEAWIAQLKKENRCMEEKLTAVNEGEFIKEFLRSEKQESYLEKFRVRWVIREKHGTGRPAFKLTIQEFANEIAKIKESWDPWNLLFKNKLIPKVIESTAHLGQTPNVIAEIWMGYTGSDHPDLHRMLLVG